MLGRLLVALLACSWLIGCDKQDPENPDPGNPGTEVQVASGDRLGWTQPASDTADISSIQFVLYIDGTRTTLAGASCVPSGAAFDCSAPLPALTAGSHTLELASFIVDGSVTAESPRSPALRVVAVARFTAASFASPQSVVTADRQELTLSLVSDGLTLPSDIAVLRDGSMFVAERGGFIRILRGGDLAVEPALDVSAEVHLPEGGLLSIAIDPKFDDTGLLYALYAAAGPRESTEFVVARFRYVSGRFGERAVLLDRAPASPAGAEGAIRIGPDGKLYVALDSDADPFTASSLATYNGKVLRLNADATTPDDQADRGPIFSLDHPMPNALAWQPGTGTMWVVDAVGPDGGRLSAVSKEQRQSRAASRTSYALPADLGAASAVFYQGSVPAFRGNLFIAAERGRELMRLRFDPEHTSKIVSVERLLTDQIGAIRVVTEGADGALYLATESSVYRLGF